MRDTGATGASTRYEDGLFRAVVEASAATDLEVMHIRSGWMGTDQGPVLTAVWILRANVPIPDPDAAVRDWAGRVDSVTGVEEVLKVVLGGSDGTYAEHFSQQTIAAYEAPDDSQAATLDEAVMWLNDRCGKGVAVWLTDGKHVASSVEGELHRAKGRRWWPSLRSSATWKVGHVSIVVAQGHVLLIDVGDADLDEPVWVYGTYRVPPKPYLWPGHDPHLVVGLFGVGQLHIAEQEQVARLYAN